MLNQTNHTINIKKKIDIKVKQGMFIRTSQDQKGLVQFKQMQLKGFHLCQPGSNKIPYPTNPSKNPPKMAENGRKFTVENFGTTYLDPILNKLA